MNTITLTDLQHDDDHLQSMDLSNDVFAQARQRSVFGICSLFSIHDQII
jgi:hypothetical protein